MELSIGIGVTADSDECEDIPWTTKRQFIAKVSEALISAILETTKNLRVGEIIEREAFVDVDDCTIYVRVSIERED